MSDDLRPAGFELLQPVQGIVVLEGLESPCTHVCSFCCHPLLELRGTPVRCGDEEVPIVVPRLHLIDYFQPAQRFSAARSEVR
ncbi:hypothetical protein ACIP9X_19275 [Arthrobacter sp. NPDC093125]|uniref:hypothetical protein n=1 Tax=Arthrobacter sp. NPDC093125 TaxID=3363944 RepID=UPI00380BE9FE